MPVNNILGSSGGGNPVDLYKVSQTNSQSSGSNSQQAESTQRFSQKEDGYSVQISQEAVDRQQQDRARQAEFEQKLQADQEVRAQADKDLQKQRVEAADRVKQQSIDVVA